MKHTAAVTAASDKSGKGLREEAGEPAARTGLGEAGSAVMHAAILSDEREQIGAELRDCAAEGHG